jgi:hypothetical protein
VLVTLIVAIGYGGWSVLQEVQRVQLAPVEEAPNVLAEIDPLQPAADAPKAAMAVEAGQEELASDETGGTNGALDRLYRPQALDVPVLTARDGPIAAIDPNEAGVLAGAGDSAIDAAIDEALGGDVQVVAAAAEGVEILAVCPAWVQVSSADGTVLFEKILDAGERYAVPALEETAQLRSGNSGSIYFLVNGTTYGPAAPGAQVVKNLALDPSLLMETYALADLGGVDATGVAVADASQAVTLCP